MANPIEITFEGGGTLIDDLKTLAKASADLSVVHRKAHDGIQDDLQKSAEEAKALGKDMDAASKTVVVLGKEATKTAKATGDAVAASRKQAAQIIADNEKLTEAQKKQAAAAGGITKEYEDIAVAASKAKAQQVAAFEQPIGLLDQIQARLELLGQKKLSLTDEDAIARANDEIERLQIQYDGINNATTQTVNGTKELRARIKEALDQAVRARAAFGDLSPEFKAAADEAARLQKELKDTQDRVKALNPGDKVAAFSQLGNAIAGGAQAISGFAIALGGNNQALQETLFKFQSVLFAVQGAQSFLKDFSDSIANVRAVLGLTTQAQVVSTAATEADVVAKEAQTAATVTTTGATTTLTTAVRALTASMLANPFLLVAAAVIALAGAIYLMTRNTETVTERLDRMEKALDRVIARRKALRDAGAELTALDDEARMIASNGSAQARRAEIEIRGIREASRLRSEAADLELRTIIERARLEDALGQLKRANEQRDASGIKESFELVKEITGRLEELGNERIATTAAVEAAEKRSANELAQFDKDQKKEAADRAKELARLRLQITEDLASQLEAAEKEIQQRIAALELEQADPRERLALERAAADEQIALLERNLLREEALQRLRVQIGTEAFAKLTEAQKKARADAIIDAGGVDLTLKQEQAINALRLATEEKFGDELAAVLQEEAQTRIDLLLTGQAQEQALFELDLQKKVERLRLAKRTEAEVIAFEDRERAKFALEQNEKAIALDEQLQTALIEGRVRGAETEKEFERRKQLDLLAIKIGAAQRRLKLLENDNTEEGRVVRAQTQALIADLTQQSEALKRTPLDINLLDLLGIAEEDQARVQEALSSIAQSTQQIFSTINQERQREVELAIAATDAIISDAQRRRTELQNELDQALDDQREGYANNADAIREQIEATKVAEKAALEDRKRLIAENQRLAKQQARIDSALQVSSLITANARLFEKGALAGPPGIIAAIAAAVAMLATFLSLKSKIAAAGSQGPQFRHGGRLKDSLLVGPSHEGGGIALLDRRTGHYYGEAEGGEGIVRRSSMAKRGDMVDAINKDDFARIQRHARQELERTGHMVLSRKQLARMRSQTESFGSAQAGSSGLGAILLELVSLREELASFKRQEGQRERVDGNERRLPQHKTITR